MLQLKVVDNILFFLFRISINYPGIADLPNLLIRVSVIFLKKLKSLFNQKDNQNEFYITRITLR